MSGKEFVLPAGDLLLSGAVSLSLLHAPCGDLSCFGRYPVPYVLSSLLTITGFTEYSIESCCDEDKERRIPVEKWTVLLMTW